MTNKVKTIILRDRSDEQFDDLITFKSEVSFEDILNKIEELKKNNEDYTNEDVYNALRELEEFEIVWIGQYDIVEY